MMSVELSFLLSSFPIFLFYLINLVVCYSDVLLDHHLMPLSMAT